MSIGLWWIRRDAWVHCVALGVLLFLVEPFLGRLSISIARIRGGASSLAWFTIGLQLVVLLVAGSSVVGLAGDFVRKARRSSSQRGK